jgi:hypothetical protein
MTGFGNEFIYARRRRASTICLTTRSNVVGLRVTVQLTDTVMGAQLWVDTHERVLDADKVFDIQDDLVEHLIQGLQKAGMSIDSAGSDHH